ncbi:hypothetical protein BN2127_JRS1_00865 [Bacillus cereus]|nr:hypothetical protein BN2127_JRS1_00865 [Bacillus cereus]
MFICKDHVLNGLKFLNLPNVKKTKKNVRCYFCKEKSFYELYYVDYESLPILPKKIKIGSKE